MWDIPPHKTIQFKVKKHRYCVCIPVINEGDNLKKQLLEMEKFTHMLDIMIADGGSDDNSINPQFLKSHNITALLIKSGSAQLSAQLRMVYGFALQQRYEGIITIDGNKKDDVKDIPQFVYALREGYDLVQGSRFLKGGRSAHTPWLRYWAIRLLHAPLISASCGFFYTDTTNGFRAYSKRFLLDPQVKPLRNIFQRYELLFYLSMRAAQLKYRIKEIPVSRTYPRGKIPTKISFLRGNIDICIALFKTVMGFYNP